MTPRAWTAIVAASIVAGLIAAYLASWYQTSDFFCFYHGARSILLGQDPYDGPWWARVTGGVYRLPIFQSGFSASSCPGRFGYPLWTAVALLPFAVLPIEVAATLWSALAIGASIAGSIWAWRAVSGPRSLAPLFGALVVTAQPSWILLISGQLSGVELGLAGLAMLGLARSRVRLSGVIVAAMAVKPQTVALTLPGVFVFAMPRHRRLVSSGLLALAAMVVMPMMFVPRWPVEWFDELTSRRLRVTALLPTAWGLAADVFGNLALAILLIALIGLACWWIVRRSSPTLLDAFVLSLPLSLFATPYAWSYDHLVLVVCWAFLLARAPARGAWRLLTLGWIAVIASALPWTLYAIAFVRGGETLSAVVPALVALSVAVAIRASERTAADRSLMRVA